MGDEMMMYEIEQDENMVVEANQELETSFGKDVKEDNELDLMAVSVDQVYLNSFQLN